MAPSDQDGREPGAAEAAARKAEARISVIESKLVECETRFASIDDAIRRVAESIPGNREDHRRSEPAG